MTLFSVVYLRTLRLSGCIIAFLSCSSLAHAQETVYTDSSLFNLACSNLTLIDFSTANVNGSNSITFTSSSSGMTLSGVNFVGKLSDGTYSTGVVGPNFYPSYSGWPGNPTVLTDGSNSTLLRTLTITLPNNITAVGTNLYTAYVGDGSSNSVSTVTFTLNNGDKLVFNTFEKPDLAFAGFTSTAPISSIQVTTPGNTFPYLSSFVFGQAVPESSTIVTALLGLTGAASLRRRRIV